MKSFSDLLETVAAAGLEEGDRDLVALDAVKLALRIADVSKDGLIEALIPRATQLIVEHCRLARGAAVTGPTFARETLRATWYADCGARGCDIHLPWRPPLVSIASVVEDGATLSPGSDFVLLHGRSGRLRRLVGERPASWSTAKIVVTFSTGFETMPDDVDPALTAAAIEQLSAMIGGAGRDPAIRSESFDGVGAVAYNSSGGDILGANVLLPSVRDMLAPWRNPTP